MFGLFMLHVACKDSLEIPPARISHVIPEAIVLGALAT